MTRLLFVLSALSNELLCSVTKRTADCCGGVIESFRRSENEICALLGCYTWTHKTGQMYLYSGSVCKAACRSLVPECATTGMERREWFLGHERLRLRHFFEQTFEGVNVYAMNRYGTRCLHHSR
jgi:hypothetical protein